MEFDVFTLLPEVFPPYLESSILQRASQRGLINVRIHNIRDWARDKHHVTDDEPYGGGGGMVMKVEPLFAAVESVLQPATGEQAYGFPVILLTPQGRVFNQAVAMELARQPRLALICGRYEGVDERIRAHLVTDQISIGDYVLTGGELPALILIDAVARLLPGVLGDPDGAFDDSHATGLLEYPHYTRPPEFRGWGVPDVLVSGNHARINRWRREQSLRRTWKQRPDLLEKADLDEADRKLLEKIIKRRKLMKFRYGKIFLLGLGGLLLIVTLLVPGCASTSIDCKQVDVFCVGLVTDVGRRDDHAYNQAAWEGIQQAKTSGLANSVASIETVDSKDYEENIKVFGEAGYDVIVTVGSAMGAATRAAATTYPDSYFIGVDQDQSTSQDFSTNLAGLVFPEDQIGYLAGALAALLSKTGQIDAVCASDALPAMQRYGKGFLAGAANISSEVKATVAYHNEVDPNKSMDDPEWGAAKANSLVDSGADIIFGIGGATGNNAIVAAVARGAYAIGADTDQYYALPVASPHLYASIVKMIAPGIAGLIKLAKQAQSGNSAYPSGNYQGQVGLSPYHDLDSSVPDEIKARMLEINQALLSGEIQTGVSITNP